MTKLKLVFQNHETKSIKALLKEIGKEHYDSALKDEGISQAPITMKGFYIEFEVDTKNLNLYYRYPNVTLFIMSVLGYWNVPKDGWKMVRKEEQK